MIRICVMVGGKGRGSNMAAIARACSEGRIRGEVVLVIGTKPDSQALALAADMGIVTEVVSARDCADDAAYEQRLLSSLLYHQANLICLAGYMRLLPSSVVRAYSGRCLNTHPALLPFFGGRGMYGERVHRAVLDSGMKVSGCTVHFVDDEYDAGPIIAQTAVPVEESDTEATLASRVLAAEHETYIRAIALFAEGRLHIHGRRVTILSDNRMEDRCQ